MKIEQEIKQVKFESSLHKVIVNLMFTYNWHRDLHNEIFKEFDIQPQHFNILRILRGRKSEPISPGYIKEVMIDKGVDLTRLLDKLEKMGLVRRELCPSNRRKIDVYITEEGLNLLERISPKIKELYSFLKHNLSEEDAEQLSELLDKLRG